MAQEYYPCFPDGVLSLHEMREEYFKVSSYVYAGEKGEGTEMPVCGSVRVLGRCVCGEWTVRSCM